jgi:hypothetical protein
MLTSQSSISYLGGPVPPLPGLDTLLIASLEEPAMAWPPRAAAAVMPAVTAGTQSAATLHLPAGPEDGI